MLATLAGVDVGPQPDLNYGAKLVFPELELRAALRNLRSRPDGAPGLLERFLSWRVRARPRVARPEGPRSRPWRWRGDWRCASGCPGPLSAQAPARRRSPKDRGGRCREAENGPLPSAPSVRLGALAGGRDHGKSLYMRARTFALAAAVPVLATGLRHGWARRHRAAQAIARPGRQPDCVYASRISDGGPDTSRSADSHPMSRAKRQAAPVRRRRRRDQPVRLPARPRQPARAVPLDRGVAHCIPPMPANGWCGWPRASSSSGPRAGRTRPTSTCRSSSSFRFTTCRAHLRRPRRCSAPHTGSWMRSRPTRASVRPRGSTTTWATRAGSGRCLARRPTLLVETRSAWG